MIMIRKVDKTLLLWVEHGAVHAEGMLNESENDDGECELLPSPAKKKCSTRSGHTLHSISESLNPKWNRKVLRPK